MLLLPGDIVYQITDCLELDSLLSLSLVNRWFYYLLGDNLVWKKRYLQDFRFGQTLSCWEKKCWRSFYLSLKQLDVYAWKTSPKDFTDLGVSSIENMCFEPFRIDSFVSKEIIEIALTNMYLYALDRLGHVYFRRTPSASRTFDLYADHLLKQGGSCMASIVNSEERVAGYSKENAVWYCSGDMSRTQVKGIQDRVIHITSDFYQSTYALTEQGQIWLLPKPYESTSSSELLRASDSRDPFQQLVVLKHHCLVVLTRSGRLLISKDQKRFIELDYFSGPGARTLFGFQEEFVVCVEQGQVLFGHLDFTPQTLPILIPNLQNKSVSKVFFSRTMYAALTQKGEMLVWRKRWGETEPLNVQTTDQPVSIRWFQDKNIASIALYDNQCVILATKKDTCSDTSIVI
ncbi:hypothetical protein BY458DRAFT_154663 [Sporodiniella umbellata]|nr:hypothetical protein BY458DRAFT_154663 [Sporodiniella umbellata]